MVTSVCAISGRWALSSQPVVPAWLSPLDDVTGFLGLTDLLAAGDATKPRYLEDGVDAEYLSD